MRHVEGYRSHPGCELAAVCDLSREKLDAFGRDNPGVTRTERAEEILDDPSIDVVSIATYDDAHHGQIVRALRNGKHVFAEKPVCQHEAQAQEIRRLLAENPRLKFSANLILRLSPRFQRLKRMIDAGEMGRVYYLEGDYNYGRVAKITEGWRGKLDFYSIVEGGGVHIVDLFLWLTGRRVVDVAAFGNRIVTEKTAFRYNDLVASLLKFDDGTVAKMTCNFGCVHPHFHPFNVFGTNATFINQMGSAWLYDSRDPEAGRKEIDDAYPGVVEGGLIPNFIDAILKGTPLIVPVEDVFAGMDVCFRIESAQSGA